MRLIGSCKRLLWSFENWIFFYVMKFYFLLQGSDLNALKKRWMEPWLRSFLAWIFLPKLLWLIEQQTFNAVNTIPFSSVLYFEAIAKIAGAWTVLLFFKVMLYALNIFLEKSDVESFIFLLQFFTLNICGWLPVPILF